jgi:hypothetical protein
MKTGSIAPNFHEGTRSEYLAQYIFSSFGTSIPVPHPEDSGIDLHCTLGKRIGQRLHVENYYHVQIKSDHKDIIYEGKESVEWLLSHKYPLLICIIDKKNSHIEIFHTISLSLCSFKNKLLSITLNFGNSSNYFAVDTKDFKATLSLGPPIIEFKLSQLECKNWVHNTKELLKLWIEMDQENLDVKSIGLNCFQILSKYETNKKIEYYRTFEANFKFEDEHQQKFNDIFLRMLSMLVHQMASSGDKERFITLIDSIKSLTTIVNWKDSWGVQLLACAVNTGATHLGINELMIINRNGQKITPIGNIENK